MESYRTLSSGHNGTTALLDSAAVMISANPRLGPTTFLSFIFSFSCYSWGRARMGRSGDNAVELIFSSAFME